MSVESVINNLYSVFENPNSKKLINDKLEVVEVGKIHWVILCLLQPFYSLVGKDAFIHYRLDSVRKAFFSYYSENKKEIINNDKLFCAFQEIHNNILKKKKLKPFSSSFVTLQSNNSLKIIPLNEKLSMHLPKQENFRGLTGNEYSQLSQDLGVLFDRLCQQDMRSYFVKWSKKTVQGKKIRKYRLFGVDKKGIYHKIHAFTSPRTLFFVPNKGGKGLEIFLFTKIVIAKGGETTVKRAFSILTDKSYVKKKISNKEEIPIIEGTVGKEGFLKEVFFRVLGDKYQVIEPECVDDLAHMYVRLPYEENISLIKDILSGLANLHKMVIPSIDCTDGENHEVSPEWFTYPNGHEGYRETIGPKQIKKQNVPNFHGDLKPGNILVYFDDEEGRNKAALTDLSPIFSYQGTTFTPFFAPPDKICRVVRKIFALGRSSTNIEKVADFHHKFGQACDMWSMGLVILRLLVRTKSLVKRSPTGAESIETLDILTSYEKELFQKPSQSFDNDQDHVRLIQDVILKYENPSSNSEFPSHITQEMVDVFIEKAERELFDLEFTMRNLTNDEKMQNWRLFQLAKEMLKVDPEKRITAARALEKLNGIRENT